MPEVNMVYDNENPTHAMGSACCNIVINGVLCYFMYTYAYKNPDLAEHGNCWANDDTDYGTLTNLMNDRKNISKEF